MPSQETYTLVGTDILRDTGKAILVATDVHPDGIWIPTSQVEKIVHGNTREESSVRMTAWIAKQKGLI